jgi:UDP:flavonoid glycosyltransferase YjiC (YdhE family)
MIRAMARITLIASGTRGDVQPAIALGTALRDAGYRVRLVAGAGFRAWIEAHGLEAAPSRVDMQAIMASPAGRAWVEHGHDQRRQLRFMRELLAEHADTMIADAAEASEDADLVLSGFTSDAYALAIGERRGIPVASLPLQPAQLATRDGRAMAAAPFPNRVSVVNRWFGRLILEPFPWRMYGEAVNRFRRSIGLAAQTGAEHLAQRRAMPTLHGMSRHVVPLPADWPATCHVTGYWFLDEEPGWTPPPELERFLDAGPPPVVLGFGSMTGGDADATAALVLDAVARAECRAILLAGWSGLDPAGLPPTILGLEEAPHGWLFPRTAAVVHHGGAGTTAAAFRAGVPQVVVPHMADQPYWGRRVHALGAGPKPLPRHRLTADGLAAAIRAATTYGSIGERATALATAIAGEDGRAEAVRRIQSIVAPAMT